MIIPNIEQKLETTASTLASLQKLSNTPLETFILDGTADCHTLPNGNANWQKWCEPFTLFEQEKYYWFKAEFTIDKLGPHQKKFLCINTFIGGVASTIRPQGLLYLNGKVVCGVDINHTDILLEEGHYTMLLHFYTHTFINNLPIHFTLKTVDERISSLYYDIAVPLEGMKLLLKTTNEYYLCTTTMERVVNLIDFRNPYSTDFYNSLEVARSYLYENYYNKLCGKTDATVCCIGHTHIDVAWLWNLQQTKLKVERSFSTVLKLMDEYSSYRFMTSQPQLFAFLKQENPQLFEQIKKKVYEGRWEMDGSMWLEADCNLTSGESLVRQMYYGKKFFKEEFGVDCNCVWLPDVFGYSGAMPQILKKSGINRFVTAKIGWNDTNRFPYDAFVWQGIDGSKVFAYLLSTCYCDPRTGIYDTTYTTYCPEIDARSVLGTWNRFQQKEYTSDVIMSYGFGDGGGGPTREMLEREQRLEYGIPGLPKTKIASLKQTLDNIENNFHSNADELKRCPKWNGELYFEFHRGTLTSVPRNKMNNRRAEYSLLNSELLSAISSKLFGNSYPTEKIDEMWKLCLLNQFHDILPGSAIESVYQDSDKQYAEIFDQTTALTTQAFDSLANSINTNGGYAVFNPNGFETNGTIVVDGKVRVVENVPSFGYKVVDNFEDKSSVVLGDKCMENSYYKVVFDKSGAITSILDKRENREIVANGEKFAELRCYEDMPYEYDNWEMTPYHKQKEYLVDGVAGFTALCEGDRKGFAITKKYMSSQITQKVYLYEDGIDRIDFVVDTDWKEKKQLLKLRFPVDMLVDKANYEVQFGNVERSTSENTSWDSACFESVAHKWVDISEQNYGVAILNNGKYGFGSEDNVLTMTVLKSGSFPYYNATEVVPEFTYSIVSHKGNYAQGGVVRKATLLNRPLLCKQVACNKNGSLPSEYSFVGCSASDVIVETIKQSTDGIIVRMYEAHKMRSTSQLSFGFDVNKVYLCDLMENELEELKTENNKVNVDIKPFEIITLKIK